jgi:hypothetical protein
MSSTIRSCSSTLKILGSNATKTPSIGARSTPRPTSDKERASLSTRTDARMRANGRTTRGTAEAMRSSLTVIFTKASSVKERHTGRDSISGSTARSTMVSGPTALRKATESGRVPMESHTSVNGRAAKQRDTECTSGLMVTGTKASGNHVFVMETVQTSFLTVICTLGNIPMENLKVMVNINGQTATHIKAHSRMGLSMVMENGRKNRLQMG